MTEEKLEFVEYLQSALEECPFCTSEEPLEDLGLALDVECIVRTLRCGECHKAYSLDYALEGGSWKSVEETYDTRN